MMNYQTIYYNPSSYRSCCTSDYKFSSADYNIRSARQSPFETRPSASSWQNTYHSSYEPRITRSVTQTTTTYPLVRSSSESYRKRFESPARYMSPAPSQEQSRFSYRRLSDMRPPPPKPRELPPIPPRPLRRHYPLPIPSFPDAMVAVSKRLRNRSMSPAPRYAELQLAVRPALVNAALGRETPSREILRKSLLGSPSPSYIYSSSRHL